MDNVMCTGNEERLMDCTLSLSHNCGHHQDAGVRCTLSTYGKQINNVYSDLTESSPVPSLVIITSPFMLPRMSEMWVGQKN